MGRKRVGAGEGEGTAREEVGEVGVVGEDVGMDPLFDLEGSDLETVDEESEIRS